MIPSDIIAKKRNGEELKNRDINKIPHPFIIDTMQLFKDEPISEKSKIYFIHLNHTNPLLNKKSFEYQNLIKNKFKIAYKNDKISL